MNGSQAVATVVATLESLGIPYLLAGSYSSNFYGIPRSTHDADFVVQLGERSIREVADRLGASFRLDPQMSFETVTLTRRHVVEVVGQPFKIEFFYLSDDPHDQERFRRRLRQKTPDRDVYFPTVEDVIVTKLRWADPARRNKDWDDLRDVIAVQRERIDWDYVHGWCARHGTRAVLDAIRATVPDL